MRIRGYFCWAIGFLFVSFMLFFNTSGGAMSQAVNGADGGGTKANEAMTESYQAGQRDDAGHYLGGTEFINLAAFEGRLFGGVGYWEDAAHGQPDPGKDTPGPQVLVLETPHGKWRQDVAFSEIKNNRRRYLRLTALQVITFSNTRDKSGKVIPLKEPVKYLIAGLDGQTVAGGNIFVRVGDIKDADGATGGNWIECQMAKGDYRLQSFRAFTCFKDRESGLDRVFAGVGAQKDDLSSAIFSGYYDQSMSGPVKIHWDNKPEYSGFEHRVMSFVEADGKLYFAAKPCLYVRDRGGDKPVWRKCYEYPLKDRPPVNGSKHTSGLRGLTYIDDPVRPGKHAILTAYEGVPGEIMRIDPATGAAVDELRTYPFLRALWMKRNTVRNEQDKRYILLAYNEMLKIDGPQGAVRLLPLLAHSINSDENHSAWCLTRKEGASNASGYSLHEVRPITESRKLSSDPGLWAIRTIAVSPFPEDQGKVLYFGGYDAHSQVQRNTAWLYRAGVDTFLKPYGQ